MIYPNIFDSRNKLGNIALAAGYSAYYDYIYEHYMYEAFDYMGVEYSPMGLAGYFLFIAIAASPLLAYRGFSSLSAGFSILVYVLVYIPCIHALFITNNLGAEIIGIYSFVFWGAMSCFFLTDGLYLWKKAFLKRTIRPVTFHLIEIITFSLLTVLLIYNASRLQMVNIFSESETMYELRSEYGGTRARWMKYLIQWLATAFFPMLLIYYLKTKSYIKYGLVMAGYFVVFMMDMQKITFLLPFVLTTLYFVIDKRNDLVKKYFHAGLLGGMVVVSWPFYICQDNVFLFTLGSIFILRTMCISGYLLTLYIHFFETHPYTYYTHINIVNWATNAYPYSDVLGRAVAEGSMNANATFWITDGVAAMGWSGIIVISAIFILFKTIFNSIELRYDRIFCIMIFLPAVSAMLNASLFTSILSCGFLILYLIFKYIHIETLEIKR